MPISRKPNVKTKVCKKKIPKEQIENKNIDFRQYDPSQAIWLGRFPIIPDDLRPMIMQTFLDCLYETWGLVEPALELLKKQWHTISIITLFNWKRKYPEFWEAVQDLVDSLIWAKAEDHTGRYVSEWDKEMVRFWMSGKWKVKTHAVVTSTNKNINENIDVNALKPSELEEYLKNSLIKQ